MAKYHGKGKGFARSIRFVVEELEVKTSGSSDTEIAEVVKVHGSRKVTYQIWKNGVSYLSGAKSADQAVDFFRRGWLNVEILNRTPVA